MTSNAIISRWHYKLLSNICKGVSSRSMRSPNIISCALSTSSISLNEQFKMPERIERSSIDILKALDSTIRRDQGGPHYRYHDDPFLYPTTSAERRIYALSKESGRKAANWIRNTNPELFVSPVDQPVIKDFLPEELFTRESDVTEHTLQELIDCARVTEAATVYRIYQEKGIEVSSEMRQSLLELMSFYNEEDPPSDEFKEEAAFTPFSRPGHSDTTNVWKSLGLAEELFDLQGGSPESYAAIIRGLAKFYHVDDAWRLYDEAVQTQVPIDLDTYNALILTTPLKSNIHEECWNMAMSILRVMSKQSVRPNIMTLNNCLQVLSLMLSYSKCRSYSVQLVAEMKLQGVQPSLGTYAFLLTIHHSGRNSKNSMLYNILDEMERAGGNFELQDSRDTFFFMQAMNVCKISLQDMDAANRVHELLEHGNNYTFMNNELKEIIYYRAYMTLAVSSLPLGQFMDIYNTLVPHVYAVDGEVMERIISTVATQGDYKHLPVLWSDMCAFGHENMDNVVFALLSAMVHYSLEAAAEGAESGATSAQGAVTSAEGAGTSAQGAVISAQGGATSAQGAPTAEDAQAAEDDVSLKHQLLRIIQHLIKNIKAATVEENNRGQRKKITWTCTQGSQMLDVVSVCGSAAVGAELLTLLLDKPDAMVGDVDPSSVKKLLNLAKIETDVNTALTCALYCNEFDATAARDMAVEVANMDHLQTLHRAKLAIVFGSDILPKTKAQRLHDEI